MWIEPGFSATAWADTTASLLDSPTTKDSKVNFGFRFVTHSSLKSSVTSLLGLLSFVSWSGHAKYSDSYALIKEFFEMIGEFV